MTNKSTHWVHEKTEMDCLPESLQDSPEGAANQYLTDVDFATTSWDDRDELQSEGRVDIKFIGLMETTEIIDDPEQQFDGYEPGQIWYKKTGEKAVVRASLKFELITSTIDNSGGDK